MAACVNSLIRFNAVWYGLCSSVCLEINDCFDSIVCQTLRRAPENERLYLVRHEDLLGASMQLVRAESLLFFAYSILMFVISRRRRS